MKKKQALIISGRGVQDQELVYPYYRLQEAGFEVTLAAPDHDEFHGIQGVKFTPVASLADEAEVVGDYDVLVIPGGVKCMEHLRLNNAAVYVLKVLGNRKNCVIAAICSGALMLVAANLCRGRRISGYPAWRVDIENAGAKFVDGVVTDGRFVTAPHYRDLGPWMAAVLKAVRAL